MSTTTSTWIDRQDQVKVEAMLPKVQANERVMSYAGDDLRFGLFLAVADSKCSRMTGVGIFDLEDYLWRDAYDDGLSPSEALHGCLVDAGYIDEE